MEELINLRRDNILLLKADLGRSKPSLAVLPEGNFTYGKALIRDKQGARETVNDWKFHTKSVEPIRERNFKMLNKMSIKEGLSTSKAFRSARKLKDTLAPSHHASLSLRMMLPEEAYSYGIPNKPSTPMESVIGNEYGAFEAQKTLDIYRLRKIEYQPKPAYLPKLTKSTILSSEKTLKKMEIIDHLAEKPVFKMKKFQNVNHKIDDINDTYIVSRRGSIKSHQRSFSIGHHRFGASN